MHRLTTRVRQLEKQCRASERFVLIPLPGQPEGTAQMPRTFAEFPAEKGQECERSAGGRYCNRTDGQWVEC
jgi:hypothetical protein